MNNEKNRRKTQSKSIMNDTVNQNAILVFEYYSISRNNDRIYKINVLKVLRERERLARILYFTHEKYPSGALMSIIFSSRPAN